MKINKLLQGNGCISPKQWRKVETHLLKLFFGVGYVIVPRSVWLLFCYLGRFVDKKLIHLTSSNFIDVVNNIRVFGIIHLTTEKRAKISTHGCLSFFLENGVFGGYRFSYVVFDKLKFLIPSRKLNISPTSRHFWVDGFPGPRLYPDMFHRFKRRKKHHKLIWNSLFESCKIPDLVIST